MSADAIDSVHPERDIDRLLHVDEPNVQELLKAARSAARRGDNTTAIALLARVAGMSEAYPDWQAAAVLSDRIGRSMDRPPSMRAITVWIANSYTVTQFTPLLRLAALRFGLWLDLREGTYGQFQQEILDPQSALYRSEPGCVLLAVHAGDILFPESSEDPDTLVSREVERWRGLWSTVGDRCGARVIMHNFAVPDRTPFGHLARQLPGSRPSMMGRLNDALAREVPDNVAIVDCEMLASSMGKRRWFDAKYWHLSRQACALSAMPLLAKHTSAVIAASAGLAKKCIVLDLDNTLWGGVVGEDGVQGIRVGSGDPEGEAYRSFQMYLKDLRQRGILLAVCSKNNPNDAREPFLLRPEMALSLDDFASFQASWDAKSKGIEAVAKDLGIGLDSLVFVDDNPFEREAVRRVLPEVETIALPVDPSGFQEALAASPLFEVVKITREDLGRTALYRARSEALRSARQADTVDDFLDSLGMRARISGVDKHNIVRVAQLIQKTNQFNLTTKRYTIGEISQRLLDKGHGLFALSLDDRFGDHGLVGVMGWHHEADTFDVDLWLMSCRVIGRTVEDVMMDHLVRTARAASATMIRGAYIPTAKNALVADLYPRLGFVLDQKPGNAKSYSIDVARWFAPKSNIRVE